MTPRWRGRFVFLFDGHYIIICSPGSPGTVRSGNPDPETQRIPHNNEVKAGWDTCQMTERILEKRLAANKLLRYPEFSPLRKHVETLSEDSSALCGPGIECLVPCA